ncbi:hypothetical protein Peur_010054 [Populus x canadensis]
MWTNPWQKGDVEVETYPAVLDGPRNRWIFIRKVYIIIAIQLLVTVAVANTVVSVHPISSFIVHTTAGLAVYCPLYYLHRLRPVNYLLLGIFTIALGPLVGLTSAFTSGVFAYDFES